jgi:hypothetical protein
MQKWQAYRDKMQEQEREQIERMMSQQKGSE